MISIPMALTGIRLFSPLLVPLLIVQLWPLPSVGWHIFLTVFFLGIGFTDLLDGYLARRFGEVTKLGRLLDPIADKFLIISTLLALLSVQAIGFVWILILVLREIFVMAVRYVACEHGCTISVSWMSKTKTWLQILLIAYVLSPWGISSSFAAIFFYYVLVLATVFSAIYAAYRYYLLCLDMVFRVHDF